MTNGQNHARITTALAPMAGVASMLMLIFAPGVTAGFLFSEYFIAYFVGLVIADTGHWLADGMP